MNLDNFKRNYKFKSHQSYDDGRRNKTLIIICIVLLIGIYYLVEYL